MQKAKQLVQTASPAQRGRKQRMQDFKQFIETHRKSKTVKQIVSEYCIKSGLRTKVVEGYFKLFVNARIYVRPCYDTEWKILTPEECEALHPQ